ncbi:unnamed protein product [Ectocarpus sp. 8 AP-2014]
MFLAASTVALCGIQRFLFFAMPSDWSSCVSVVQFLVLLRMFSKLVNIELAVLGAVNLGWGPLIWVETRHGTQESAPAAVLRVKSVWGRGGAVDYSAKTIVVYTAVPCREGSSTQPTHISENNPLFGRPNFDFEHTKSSRSVALRPPVAGFSTRGAPPTYQHQQARGIWFGCSWLWAAIWRGPTNPDNSGETILANGSNQPRKHSRWSPTREQEEHRPQQLGREGANGGGHPSGPRVLRCATK